MDKIREALNAIVEAENIRDEAQVNLHNAKYEFNASLRHHGFMFDDLEAAKAVFKAADRKRDEAVHRLKLLYLASYGEPE